VSVFRRTLALTALLAVLPACLEDAAVPAASGSDADPSTSSAGGGSSVSTAASGAAPTATHLFASIRLETQPGEAPAMVTFHNDTSGPHTLWIADSTFYNIAAAAKDGPRLATTADLLLETSIGLHLTDKTCLKKNFESFEGPPGLEPQRSYVVRAYTDDVGYHGVAYEETASVGFTAARALVHDPFPAQAPGASSTVELVAADAASPQPTLSFEVWSGEYATSYVLVPADFQLAKIRFLDRSGGVHVAAVDQPLSGGYTVIVAAAPAEGAAFSVDLTAL
jgi:hypothetical protein